jgi:oxalate decarboxylase/phosphoglucose isomerase-like protein (cupin superfamily)
MGVYNFEGSEPVKIRGGTLQQGFKKHLPDLEGISIQSVRLDKGAVQAPHFHPNANQLDYCLSGKARVTIINAKGERRSQELDAGFIAFVPKGDIHWFENIGEGDLHYLVVFTAEEPVHIAVLQDIPKDIVAKVLDIDKTLLPEIPKEP